MQAYQCTVRLDGEIGQTVPKRNISAAHIILLQRIHGEDGVIDIKKDRGVVTINDPTHKKMRAKTNNEELSFLQREFNEKLVGATFGSYYGAKLPDTLPEVERPADEPSSKRVGKTPSKTPSKASRKAKMEDEEDEGEEEEPDVEDDEFRLNPEEETVL